MASPTVSVVMSVFNGQAFLSPAIESILSQSFRDFEFVIIDDGSTDSTPDTLSAFASRDARVKVFRHENRGRAESLNVGIRLAGGDYIARMDADDIALPHRLREQLAFVERHMDVGLLGGAVEIMDSAGHVITTSQPPTEDSEIRSMMLRHNAFFHPAVMLRREVVLASGGYRKPLLDADDYDLWLRIAERSRLANLPGCVLQYRIHPDQVSVRNIRHQTLCVLAARAAASQRKQGLNDPLSQIEEVTSQLVSSLGVTKEQIQEATADFCGFWMPILEKSDPEAALRVIDGLVGLSASGGVARPALANALLAAAEIHRRQGRPAKALLAVARALLVRPIIAGRPIKRAFRRLAASPKTGVVETK